MAARIAFLLSRVFFSIRSGGANIFASRQMKGAKEKKVDLRGKDIEGASDERGGEPHDA